MKLKRTTAILTAGLMLAGTLHSFPTASVPAAAVSPAPAAETTAVTTTATTAKTTASTTATTAKTTASATATTAKTTAPTTATTAKTTASATATTAKTTASTTATTAQSTTMSFTAEGILGKSAAWQLSPDGHLLITGSGDLSDAELSFNQYAESIKTVELRNTDAKSVLTAVAPSMFGKCKNLTSVKLPDTIKAIGKSAFSGCSALAGINFPSALETIESHAFRETALTEIVLPGCSLGENAFYNCPNLKTVTIKEGTAIIPPECFRYCAALTDVTLPDSVTEIQCGSSSESGAFANCPALKNVSIGKSIEKIDNRAFRTEGEGNLTVTFREGATIVPDSAFTGRTELAKVVLPKSLKTIGSSAFSGCKNLADCRLTSGIQSIGKEAFKETALIEVEVPGCELGDAAFYNCTALTGVTIEEDMKIIPAEAFRYCAALEDVYLPDSVTEIQCGYSSESGAFANCPALQTVSIGKSIEKIDNRAFRTEGQGNLTVTFREGASIVPDSAFTGRTELAKVRLPESMKTIGTSAFSGCTNLAEINFPDALEAIGEQAFRETALTGIELPGCTLGAVAFYNCPNLKTVTIKEGTPTIPNECFRYCAALTDVTLPDSVTEIQCGYSSESGAFADCPALQTVSIGKSIEKIDSRAFRTNGEGNLTVTFREGTTAVPADAFAGRTELAKVILPESMKTIGSKAFSGCANLAECNFPDALESIGEQAFRETALTAAAIPGCELGAAAFYNCQSLAIVSIDEGTTAIPAECFRYCAALTDVYLPDSVTEMQCGYSSESGALANCPSLTNISVGKGIQKIDSRALRTESEDLTVTFRDGVTAIPANALNSGFVKKVILPETVTEIDAKAIPANVVICAPEKSAAQTFAETNERTFEAMAAAFYDLNGDGKLTAADAELLVQILSETLPAGAKMPDAAHLSAADCDQDGLLTMADVRMLLDMAAPES